MTGRHAARYRGLLFFRGGRVVSCRVLAYTRCAVCRMYSTHNKGVFFLNAHNCKRHDFFFFSPFLFQRATTACLFFRLPPPPSGVIAWRVPERGSAKLQHRSCSTCGYHTSAAPPTTFFVEASPTAHAPCEIFLTSDRSRSR